MQRRRALEALGCVSTPIDTGWRQKNPPLVRRVVRGLARRLGYALELAGENEAIVRAAESGSYDLLWIDKGLTIRPDTIRSARRACPGLVVVSCSVDDMGNPENQSRHYLRCVPLYDLHVTTKEPNVNELRARGARQVMRVDNGYDPTVHRPVELTDGDRGRFGADVAFVGGHERERAACLVRLARAGVSVRVWGNRWHRLRERPVGLRVEERPVFADDYARVLCASRINLAFLRKVNRDTQTTRSVEIPACGGFMLAERTDDHQRLFEEDREAAFFDSEEELSHKIRHYLAHDAERSAIARRGRERCLRSGYSNAERLAPVLERCREIHGGC